MSEFNFEAGALDGVTWTENVSIPADLRYLEGHFPGDPIVPGVAQVISLAEERARHAWPDLGASTGLRRLKFMSALRPGHSLTLTLTRKEDGKGGTKVVFGLTRDDTDCSKGTLLFS